MVLAPKVFNATEPIQSTSDAEAPPCKELFSFLITKHQAANREIRIEVRNRQKIMYKSNYQVNHADEQRRRRRRKAYEQTSGDFERANDPTRFDEINAKISHHKVFVKSERKGINGGRKLPIIIIIIMLLQVSLRLLHRSLCKIISFPKFPKLRE